jgi:hypothetical protein
MRIEEEQCQSKQGAGAHSLMLLPSLAQIGVGEENWPDRFSRRRRKYIGLVKRNLGKGIIGIFNFFN